MSHVFQTFNAPATDEQIARVAPSVFTLAPHASRSEKYIQITTADVLRALRQEGWQVFGAGQTRAREQRRDFTKHMLRLRHTGERAQALANNDSAPEVVLINSHDGTSAYRMLGGVIRFACLNGLICAEDTVGDVRIAHSGKAIQRVTEGAFEILDGLTRVIEDRDAMRVVTLNRDEQQLFASSALQLQYEPGTAPIDAASLLNARRLSDIGQDLWTTFNRVQENVIRGGIPGRAATGRRMTTRGVTAIDKNVGLNRALWALADGMRKLKGNDSIGARQTGEVVDAQWRDLPLAA